MTDKNRILKETLKHYINLEYYANGLDEEFQTLLKELQNRCRVKIESQKSISTKTGYATLYKLIKEEVDDFQKKLEERLEEQAELVMNQELGFLDYLYNGSETKSNEPDENSVVKTSALAIGGVSLARLLFAPIDGRDTTRQFVERTEKNILRSFDTSLRSGYLFGQKTEEITAQIDSKLKQVSRGMQSGIRTAIPSYAKTTDKIVFLNNNAEVVYCAQLDGRTCIVCGSCHGLHYKSITVAPSIPQHANCRCVYLRASDITEPMPTYEEFIESLKEEEQKKILGINRYKLWKETGITLERFINNGEVIPIEELKNQLKIEKVPVKNK